MKALALALAVAALTGNVVAAEAAGDTPGSNATGSERVCVLSANAQSESGLQEALKACRRGDILDIGWLQTPQAMQLCDFSKAVLYHPTKGSVIACVYTGARRPVSK